MPSGPVEAISPQARAARKWPWQQIGWRRLPAPAAVMKRIRGVAQHPTGDPTESGPISPTPGTSGPTRKDADA